MHLPCRHHEIILSAIFKLKMPASSAPEVLVFERFSKCWPSIDLSSYKSGIMDPIVQSKLCEGKRAEMEIFCNEKLKKKQSRADYKEFIELMLVFLGKPAGNFRAPGATSHTRWVAKGIYALEIFLFRGEFRLTARELNGIRKKCIFLASLYIAAWFGSTRGISSPLQDLNFIKDCIGKTIQPWRQKP